MSAPSDWEVYLDLRPGANWVMDDSRNMTLEWDSDTMTALVLVSPQLREALRHIPYHEDAGHRTYPYTPVPGTCLACSYRANREIQATELCVRDRHLRITEGDE